MVKLGIVIPTTRKEFILDTLNSILNQTLNDIKIYIINDAPSKGHIHEFIIGLKDKYDFEYIKNEINIGLSATRNKGIDIVDTEYIYFIDDDDFLINNAALKDMCDLLDKNNTDLVTSRMMNFTNDIGITNSIESIKYHTFAENYDVSTLRPVQNKIYRVSYLRENNLRFKEGYTAEEDDFAFIKLLPLNPNISLYGGYLVNIREYEGERITRSEKYIKDQCEVYNEILDHLVDGNYSDTIKQSIATTIYKERICVLERYRKRSE